MPLLVEAYDTSQLSNQAQFPLQLAYRPPSAWFKIVQLAIIIPHLPAPLHYFSLRVIIGQPNIPVFRNPARIQTTALDTVTLVSSVSPHMQGHLQTYSIEQDCVLKNQYFQFGEHVYLNGQFPNFHLYQDDPELSVDLKMTAIPLISYFSKLRLGLYQHWSVPAQCQGQIKFKGEVFQIDQLASFDYLRAIHLPYLPICFYSYQVIHLEDQRQLLLLHVRNQFNQVMQSKIFVRDVLQNKSYCFETHVHFIVQRLYPKVQTPNHHEMYLPREFGWQARDAEHSIKVSAQSRGDFKFGVGAGYVGSFNYQVELDQQLYEGHAGYCEYIDCRPLRWQEKNQHEILLDRLEQPLPVALKK